MLKSLNFSKMVQHIKKYALDMKCLFQQNALVNIKLCQCLSKVSYLTDKAHSNANLTMKY